MALVHCHFKSEVLGLGTSMHVLLPDEARDPEERYPVLYLLHGWSDDDSVWTRRTSIERYMDGRPMIVIMPRVELSFYQDMVTGMAFWEFLTEELPVRCASWFPIQGGRENTFAAGLSMGGYGAFRLGLSYPDRYAAVASLSGALDILNPPEDWTEGLRRKKLEAIWGPGLEKLGEASDLLSLATKVKASGNPVPSMFAWCGTEDFLYSQNIRFRDHADQIGLELAYSEGAGDHTWGHWDREIQNVLNWLPVPQSGP